MLARNTMMVACSAAIGLAMAAPLASAAPTLIKLNEGIEGSWGRPLINNQNQILANKRNTNLLGGYVYSYNGTSFVQVPNTGYAYGAIADTWELNNNGQFVYTNTEADLFTANITSGNLGSIAGSYYASDINDQNTIATAAYIKFNGYEVQTSSDNLTTLSSVPNTLYLYTDYATVDINNHGHIAYRRQNEGAVYRIDAGGRAQVGTATAGSPVAIDDWGRVLYGHNSKLYLGSLPIRATANNYFNGGMALSDNGKIAWTEYNGTRYNVFTFIDGVATNLTGGLFPSATNAFYPDINNNGEIVFMVTNSIFESDVYLWTPDAPVSRAVYNGHFDGNTLYGWDVTQTAPATAELVLRGTGDYAAKLTTGSPVKLSQSLDTPGSPFVLNFDAQFLSLTGPAALDVTLNGQSIGHLTATPGDFQSYQLLVDDVTLMNLNNVTLALTWDGSSAGSVLLLDNISIVPEPTSLALLSMAGLGLLMRPRRSHRDHP